MGHPTHFAFRTLNGGGPFTEFVTLGQRSMHKKSYKDRDLLLALGRRSDLRSSIGAMMGRSGAAVSREGSRENITTGAGRRWSTGWTASGANRSGVTLGSRLVGAGSRPDRRGILAAAALIALLLPLIIPPRVDHLPTLHAALETTLASFSIATSGLLLRQYDRRRRLTDLLLAGAVSTMALLNLAVIAVPAILDLNPGGQFASTGRWGILFVGCTLVGAAWASPHRLVTNLRHPVWTAVGLSMALVTAAELVGHALAVSPTVGSVHASTPAWAADLRMVIVLAGIALLLLAAVGFSRRRLDRGGEFGDLLAAATILLAGAGFSHLLVNGAPGQVSQSLTLRILAIGLVLVAAAREEMCERRATTRAIALAERRRVARDLHDGLAQDLALIAAHTPRMARDLGHEHPVAVAARRALDISRGAISELSDPAGASTRESIDAVAEELRDRFDAKIFVDTQLDEELPPATRETVTRITREAIANAARHGKARRIVVSLTGNSSGVALRVVDDGRGGLGGNGSFTEGFGLRSMRERASDLGGYLRLQPARHGGTELEVRLP
jgi:signal transduction histidine kinase